MIIHLIHVQGTHTIRYILHDEQCFSYGFSLNGRVHKIELFYPTIVVILVMSGTQSFGCCTVNALKLWNDHQITESSEYPQFHREGIPLTCCGDGKATVPLISLECCRKDFSEFTQSKE